MLITGQLFPELGDAMPRAAATAWTIFLLL